MPATRECGNCGRRIVKATRIWAGTAYCATCYRREFKQAACRTCGAIARFHVKDEARVCRPCDRRARTCLRCDRPVPEAGLMVGGKAVCPSCAPHLQEARTCPACGSSVRRLSRCEDAGFDEAVCDACRRTVQATCSRCRRHRPVVAWDEADRPLCQACAGATPASHECLDCGASVPGDGIGRCRSCEIAHRARRRTTLNIELLEQDWVRALFAAYCSSGLLPRHAGDIAALIDRYARFFAQLDRECTAPRQVTQERLLEIFGADGLRRAMKVVGFLATALQLDWSAAVQEDTVERARIEERLTRHREEAWAGLLCRYSDALHGRGVSQKTVRMYLAAAAGLLGSCGATAAGDVEQDHIDRYLKRKPGAAASLTPFVSFLAGQAGKPLRPGKLRRGDPVRREKATIAKVRTLLQRLEGPVSPRERPPVLIEVIALLYAVPRKQVAALRKEEVRELAEGRLVLWPDGLKVVVEPVVARPLAEQMAGAVGELVFPGRNGVQPVSVAGRRLVVPSAQLHIASKR